MEVPVPLAVSARQSDDKERVRDASDIVRVVGEHVALRARGREYVGLCPFHDDHKPSMTVVPHKQIFHCFTCGAGGDVFSFIQKYHRMEFREAMVYLAERAGITLSAGPGEGDEPRGPSRADLVQANATACGFFRAILRHEEHGVAARELIERRGISEEMVEAFAIGAAPNRWDGLLMTIRGKQLSPEDFAEAGLLKAREDGFYDTFRNRLIFPIHDQIGRVIAFGGRRVDDADEPKYLNSPESRLFDKSSTLYGLHHASRAIQSQRTAIVTEGYTDVIACHQAGFENVVATLGTALTAGHGRVLRRLCDTVVLLFDSDEAGQKAADRAVEVFFAEPVDVKIATLGEASAKDPDELLKTPGGADVFRSAIAGAADVFAFRFDRLRLRLKDAGATQTAQAIEQELARLAELGLSDLPPLRRQLVIRHLARIAGVSEEMIRSTMPAGRGGERRARRGGDAPPDLSDEARAAQWRSGSAWDNLVGCVLCDGSLWSAMDATIRERLCDRAYGSALAGAIAHTIDRVAASGIVPDVTAVLLELDSLEVKDAAVALEEHVKTATEGDASRLRAFWRECLGDASRGVAEAEVKSDDKADSLVELIERRRRLHAEFGIDPTRLPRPPGVGAAATGRDPPPDDVEEG